MVGNFDANMTCTTCGNIKSRIEMRGPACIAHKFHYSDVYINIHYHSETRFLKEHTWCARRAQHELNARKSWFISVKAPCAILNVIKPLDVMMTQCSYTFHRALIHCSLRRECSRLHMIFSSWVGVHEIAHKAGVHEPSHAHMSTCAWYLTRGTYLRSVRLAISHNLTF